MTERKATGFKYLWPFFALFFLVALVSLSHAGGTEKVEREVAELKRVQETSSRILAETAQSLTVFRQEMQALQGVFEETRHFSEEETRKNEKLLRDFDYRLTGIEERLSLLGTALDDFLSKAGKGTGGSDEGSLYHRALAEINLQNYKQAQQFFDQFLLKFPKSTLADNAQYWKGEALYASKQFPQAILEFQKVVKKYPKSDKVPAAVLKQGYSFFETQNYLDAKAFLQKVITEFPASEEAASAKERIGKINRTLAGSARPQAPSSAAPAGTSR